MGRLDYQIIIIQILSFLIKYLKQYCFQHYNIKKR